MFGYNDVEKPIPRDAISAKTILFCGYFLAVPASSHANESSLDSQLLITSHVVLVTVEGVLCEWWMELSGGLCVVVVNK